MKLFIKTNVLILTLFAFIFASGAIFSVKAAPEGPFKITCQAGDGSGTDVVTENIAAGTEVELPGFPSAWTAPEGLHFSGWVVGEGEEAYFVSAKDVAAGAKLKVTADTVLRARYTGWIIAVQVSPSGKGKLELSSEPDHWVDLIDLTEKEGTYKIHAKAEDGYIFSHWKDSEGNTVSSENPYTFDLSKDTELTAVFAEPCKITCKAGDGTGTDVLIENIVPGTEITVPDFPAGWSSPEGLHFSGWLIGEGEEAFEIKTAEIADGAKYKVTADTVFEARYTGWIICIHVSPEGAGKLELSLEPDHWVSLIDLNEPEGSVTLKAKEEEGYVFSHWEDKEGKTVSSEASYSFDLKEDTEYTAVFEKPAPTPTPEPTPSPEPTPTPEPVEYEIKSGKTGSWKKESGKDFEIVIKRSENDEACFSHFVSVALDGTLLEKDKDYTAKAGSTIITLKAALLETLSTGEHAIIVNFDDDKVESTLNIEKTASTPSNSASSSSSKNNSTSSSKNGTGSSSTAIPASGVNTSDEGNLLFWMLTALLSLAAVAGMILKRTHNERLSK